MHPVALWIEAQGVARPVGSYGLLLAVAFLAALGLMARGARVHGLDMGACLSVTALTAAGAVAGGWLGFVAVEWARLGSLAQALREGGLVFFGGVLGGLCAWWGAARSFGLPLVRLADASVLPFGVAHGLGRIGCLLGGCCFGRPWDGLDGRGLGAVTYTHPLAPAAHPAVQRHAVPLYEAVAVLALAWVIERSVRRGHLRGQGLSTYFACYAVLRFGLEWLRGDAVRGSVGWLSTSQALALVVLPVALWLGRRVGRAHDTEATCQAGRTLPMMAKRWG